MNILEQGFNTTSNIPEGNSTIVFERIVIDTPVQTKTFFEEALEGIKKVFQQTTEEVCKEQDKNIEEQGSCRPEEAPLEAMNWDSIKLKFNELLSNASSLDSTTIAIGVSITALLLAGGIYQISNRSEKKERIYKEIQ